MIKKIIICFLVGLCFLSVYSQTRQHTISKGETLESIASKYGVTVDDLKAANPRLKSCIAGFKINIPASSTPSTSNSSVSPSPDGQNRNGMTSSRDTRKPTYTSAAVNDYQYYKENYGKSAGAALERAALGGYPEAMTEYASQLWWGSKKSYGIKKNRKKAAEWFLKAAALGDAKAMYQIYINGYEKEFGNLSTSQRNEWFEKAFDHGSPDAIESKAKDYLKGTHGCQKNVAKAAELYAQACHNGLNYASYENLRECAASLPGTTDEALRKARNYENSQLWSGATLWYLKAALAGDVAAMTKVADICSGSKLYQCNKAPFEWYRKAALAGDANAMYQLAMLHQKGSGGANYDQNEAFNWFNKSYEKGNNEAIMKIAEAYQYGRGVSQNYNEAKKWYALAEKKNIKGASDGIAQVARSQKNAEVKAQKQREQQEIQNAYQTALNQMASFDYADAFANFTKAAKGGIKDSYFHLGRCYEHGYGTPQDLQKARIWYKKASDSGDVRAMYLTGLLFENGIGGERNQFTAAFYYGMGMGKGDTLCTNAISITRMGGHNTYTIPPSYYAIAASQRNSSNNPGASSPGTSSPSVTSSYTPTPTPSYTPYREEPKKETKIERREITCRWCSGTGQKFHVHSHCSNDLHQKYESHVICNKCGSRHCVNDYGWHENCKDCKGTRYLVEYKVDGKWYLENSLALNWIVQTRGITLP